MKEDFYRLAEYKIIESDTGELRWESHFGLGGLQEGRCFKKGTILFIGPAENRRDGFLKLEFVDHLKQFPEWLKTKYYCESLDIFHCKAGKRVSREEMRLWMFDQGREGEPMTFSYSPGDDSNDSSLLTSKESVGFKLQTFEINKKANGQVVWKAHEGSSTLRSGICIILEDIIFMGPWQDEQTDLTRRQFFMNLKQLPDWKQTKYYCPRLLLRDCKSANLVLDKRKGWRRRRSGKEPHANKNEHKDITALGFPGGTQRGGLSGKISSFFDSLADFATRYCERGARLFRFRFRKPYGTKRSLPFRLSVIGKGIIFAVAFISLIISLCFALLIGYWNDHHKKRHYEKGEHSSSHHRDH